MAILLSVNVGLPRDVAWQGRTVSTAVWKTPVKGARLVRRLNIDGDGQADLAAHGGEHRAVYVYQIESYRYWEKQLDRNDFAHGQFGENFTVDGMADADVCIGDRYRIGEALFEVTQPRVTCYRLGLRMNNPAMPALLVKHGRPGFYFRVLEEGKVAAGDEIVRVASGPERMSVSEVNALLYLPGHPRDQLERAVRIPALSAGWRGSFEALLKQDGITDAMTGNAGLAAASDPPPAWRGFRPLRVALKTRESGNVISLTLESIDGHPMPPALPGQFVVLQLGSAPAPPLVRSYSLSGEPGGACYRVSVKLQAGAAASAYLEHELQVGDVLRVSAARGNFTLRAGGTPIVLLSAGIGVTPVLAMLHALAAVASQREIWWLYGVRNGRDHPFAGEVRALLERLAHRHRLICYSAPDSTDRLGDDFDSAGHLDMNVLKGLGLPGDGDFYVCGPPGFMSDLTAGLSALGVSPARIHTEVFGAGTSTTPGIASAPHPPPHLPAGPAGTGALVTFARSGLNVRWNATFHSLLELAEACDVPVRWSCRMGVCHMCETALVAGSVRYAPDPLDAPADGNVLICCSRPEGDVVLDL